MLRNVDQLEIETDVTSLGKVLHSNLAFKPLTYGNAETGLLRKRKCSGNHRKTLAWALF